MKIAFVDLQRQIRNLRKEIDTAINGVLERADFIQGKSIEEFENNFAKLCNKKYCVALNSGTDALEFALRAYGVKDGEVITAPNSYFSSAMVITKVGAKPVFVDVDEKSMNINVNKIEDAITKKTRAIIPIHLCGQPADLDPIYETAEKHNLVVVEDACQAHLAEYKGKIVPIGETGAFSFYPGKNLGCYDQETEVLTERGWLLFRDLKQEDRVASLVGKKMVFIKPLRIFSYDYHGEMFRYKNKAIDLFVTPNHNMYVRRWSRKRYELIPAYKTIKSGQLYFNKMYDYDSEIMGYFIIPSTSVKVNHLLTRETGEIKVPIMVWLEFFGYWISEGSLNLSGKNRKIQIDQTKKSKYYNDFKKCMENMPFKYFIEKKDSRFSIHSLQLCRYLGQFGKAPNKFIPKELKKLPPDKLRILLLALIKGDGSTYTQKSKWYGKTIRYKYYTTSKQLADDVQEIAIKCGYKANIGHYKSRGLIKNGTRELYQRYIVFINTTLSESTLVLRKHFSVEQYHGKVYCCEVPSHVLYVRRNGRTAWCGNSFGDGGALVTDNDEVADKIRILRNDGSRKKYYHEAIGFKSRLDTIQAAILNIKLKYLENWNNLRRKHATLYNSLLKNVVETPVEMPYAKHVYHLYQIKVDNRDELQRYLAEKEVSTVIHYPIPIHLQEAYKDLGYKEGDFPITEKLAKRILSLPMFPELKDEEIKYVCETVKEFANKH